MYSKVLKLWPDCGYTGRTVLVIAVSYTQLPRLENPARSSTHRKSHREVVFSFTELETTRRAKGSQEDPFKHVQLPLIWRASLPIRNR